MSLQGVTVPTTTSLDSQLESIWLKYYNSVPNTPRTSKQFLQFFRKGFEYTTLSSLDSSYHNSLIVCKTLLASFLTLCDDFIDVADLRDLDVFALLCKVPFERDTISYLSIDRSHHAVFDMAITFWEEFFSILSTLPRYNELKSLLRFDIEQMITGLQYSALLFQHPFLAHERESCIYQSNTMIMIGIGTMDLMGSPKFDIEELGLVRFLLSTRQRMGRISNVLATLPKEIQDRDLTNDILIIGLEEQLISHSEFASLDAEILLEKVSPISQRLEKEWKCLHDEIYQTGKHLKSFDIDSFLEGAERLHQLYIGLFR